MPTAQKASGATVLRIVLGRQLRKRREAAGVSLEQAAEAIGASVWTVRRIEGSDVRLGMSHLKVLLPLYGVTDEGELAAVLEMARHANQPGWWHTYRDVLPDWFEGYVGLEESATLIRGYDAQFVPGLFQTADYMRAVIERGPFRSAPEPERRISLRLARQRVLERDKPPRLELVIDEQALHRPVGGASVMRAQLRRLVECAELDCVSLTVLPRAVGAHMAMTGAFTILRFPEAELPDVVYVEHLVGAIYIDKPVDTADYALAMDTLRAASASEQGSIKIIESIAKGI